MPVQTWNSTWTLASSNQIPYAKAARETNSNAFALSFTEFNCNFAVSALESSITGAPRKKGTRQRIA